MANKQHVRILLEGVDAWNEWRKSFRRADLRDARLSGADLRGADLEGVDLSGADLRAANLRKADLHEANLQGADLRHADLLGADLRGANLQGADLRRADLLGTDLRGANLARADLTEANLTGTDLTEANLTGADLTEATLLGADLTEARLDGAKLPQATLVGAKLRQAQLQGVDLSEARLSAAFLEGAKLTACRLAGATLDHADLRGAVLSQTDLQGAVLRGANLTGAQVDRCKLTGIDLSGARLDEVSLFSSWGSTLELSDGFFGNEDFWSVEPLDDLLEEVTLSWFGSEEAEEDPAPPPAVAHDEGVVLTGSNLSLWTAAVCTGRPVRLQNVLLPDGAILRLDEMLLPGEPITYNDAKDRLSWAMDPSQNLDLVHSLGLDGSGFYGDKAGRSFAVVRGDTRIENRKTPERWAGFDGGHQALITRWTLEASDDNLPPQLSMHPEGRADALKKVFAGEDLLVGDDEFDSKVHIEIRDRRGDERSFDHRSLQALLNHELRQAIIDWTELGGRIEDGRLLLEWDVECVGYMITAGKVFDRWQLGSAVADISTRAPLAEGILHGLTRSLEGWPREEGDHALLEIAREDPVRGVRRRALKLYLRESPLEWTEWPPEGLDSEDYEAVLLELFQEPDMLTTAPLIEQLTSHGSERTIGPLVEIADSGLFGHDESVKQAARQAIEAITERLGGLRAGGLAVLEEGSGKLSVAEPGAEGELAIVDED